MSRNMTTSEKITITFVKNSSTNGAKYKKRTRTNLKISNSSNDADKTKIEQEGVDNDNCIARNRPRRGPKPIERYEPQETLLDDFSDDPESESDDDD